MKRSRFTEDQIIGILKEHEAGVSVADLCRKHGVRDATVYIYGRLSRCKVFFEPI
jgi:putative transposase